MPDRPRTIFEKLSAVLFRPDHYHEEIAEKLKAVLNNTVDGIITINDRGKIETYNKACCTIFGYEPSEVVGQNVKMLMPEPYQSEHDGYLKNYNKTGRKQIIGVGREVQGRRKDGTVFPLDLSVSEVNVDGRKIYSGIVRDITLRKQAEDEIMRSNAELERFAYIASHDLQEPLRMVANFTGLLEEEYKDEMDEQALQYMNFIIDATERMQELVNDILEYSRVGNKEGGSVEVNCIEHAQLVISHLHNVIEETRANITIDNLPTIYANPVRFTQLLQNLIGNAIKYRKKDVAPIICVKAEDHGDEWLFSVTDNGIGMKEEYLEQIFVLFKRLHGKSEYKGTGIGLAICRRIVESLDGQIWAESKLGEGSTFYFTVPKSIS
ncbi:MAG: PAS domain S-box protein [Alphaproteobacteria bacterium]|nr:PAS domain S-box protein [Alphaproteobacteria bacterium]